MNILILINGAPNYKYFFANLASSLRKEHNIFYAIDSTSSAFMEPLPQIDNDPNTYYYSDYFKENYRKSFAQLYSCTSGDFFYADFDRFLTHGYNLKKSKYYWNQMKLSLDNFFFEIIKEKNIDLVIYENVSNSFAYSAWKICELLDRLYIGLMGSRIPGHLEMQCSIIDKEVEKIKNLANGKSSLEDESWYDDYKNNIVNIQPDYMKKNALNSTSIFKLLKVKRLKTLFRIFNEVINKSSFYDYQRGGYLKKIFNNSKVNLHRTIVAKRAAKFFINNDMLNELNDAYYVYPIHYHPESSTSILAPDYTSEYVNIINIANKLPFGHFLYVKDHISAKGIHPYSFYKKICALPNVKLIDSNVNIKSLIRNSLAVITINSTAGYEALLLNKKVFIFGRVFYECFPNVVKLECFKDLVTSLKDLHFEECDMSKWFIAYKKYTVNLPLLIGNSEAGSQEYYKKLSDEIIYFYEHNKRVG